MAWLAKLDARAARWPLLVRMAYLALRWTLIVMGAIELAALYWQRLHLFTH